MKKRKSYLIKRETKTSSVFVCGSLNFDPYLNKVWSNKNKGAIFVKQNSHNRKLLSALMSNQGKLFTYEELTSILNDGKPATSIRKKYVNDKMDALKKKLKSIGLTRDDFYNMLICVDGYRLVPSRIGKHQVKTRRP